MPKFLLYPILLHLESNNHSASTMKKINSQRKFMYMRVHENFSYSLIKFESENTIKFIVLLSAVDPLHIAETLDLVPPIPKEFQREMTISEVEGHQLINAHKHS